MRVRKMMIVAALAAGTLLGWLAASGHLGRLVSAEERTSKGSESGTVLPRPADPFRGTINLRAKDSTPDFPQPIAAPKGAPNVLLVLLDDVGFGASSTFGGPCQTPTLQKLADNGL